MSQNKAQETPVCCCVDVGTIMDNTDSVATWSRVFDSKAEAEQMRESLEAKARAVESEPCQITSSMQDEAGGVRLDMQFVFSCQAESLIFQLGLR
ncbi:MULTISPECIES: YfcZ/YiiS family protein [Mangrovibacter]|uniref:Uncharacterized protein (TIGR00743 family) n=1 Tax=Mangrovibacter plantisponsor TaxID=451513 RepID=A0A317Q614_9ENTR|nr:MULTISPECIES: YfcZ/YiiS family protein [Mangrovibacter]KEA50088.1 hypothetical protein DT73_24735 [Mangrovibacter sp. MFB070]PWW09537.1 uncharacterized protein (TIGR00743 family) [Mangrovibacter plantisponsor]